MYGTTDHGHWSGSGDADEFVELYKQRTGHPIVEPAHMVILFQKSLKSHSF